MQRFGGKHLSARTAGGDSAKLAYWRLIETLEGEREDGSTRIGYHRITDKGVAFVEGRIRVPKHVFIYDGNHLGFSDETLDIREALGHAFDYGELMRAAG